MLAPPVRTQKYAQGEIPLGDAYVRVTQTNNKPDLVARQYEAKQAGDSVFSAAVSHVLRDIHFDPRGYDQCTLAITLTVFLAYLYSRSPYVVVLGFVAWFIFENVVWFALPLASPAISRHVVAVESRVNEPVFDWLLFLSSLGAAIYLFELTFVGEGVGATLPAAYPSSTGEWAALAVVSLAATLSAFVNFYYASFVLLQAAILGSYFFLQTDLQWWITVRAVVAVVYLYAWFLNPIAFHFQFNAFFALLAAVTLISVIQVVATG